MHWTRYLLFFLNQNSKTPFVFSCIHVLTGHCGQACNGATYVSIDMLQNKRDDSKMLLVEGNCQYMHLLMSLAASVQNKFVTLWHLNSIGSIFFFPILHVVSDCR